jgi:hypothetical protein
MGAYAKTSDCNLSTGVRNAISSVLIIHIIRSCLIYVAIDNPSLVLIVSSVTNRRYLWNYLQPANK